MSGKCPQVMSLGSFEPLDGAEDYKTGNEKKSGVVEVERSESDLCRLLRISA